MKTTKASDSKNAKKRINLIKAPDNTKAVIAAGILRKKSGQAVGYRTKSRPITLKPDQFEADSAFEGVLQSLTVVPAKEGSDRKPWVKAHYLVEGQENGVDMATPAMIRSALEITDDGEHATSPYIGHSVIIELGNPIKFPSKKGNDAWNFIVRISEKPVK